MCDSGVEQQHTIAFKCDTNFLLLARSSVVERSASSRFPYKRMLEMTKILILILLFDMTENVTLNVVCQSADSLHIKMVAFYGH
jgi:hypothetical protein